MERPIKRVYNTMIPTITIINNTGIYGQIEHPLFNREQYTKQLHAYILQHATQKMKGNDPIMSQEQFSRVITEYLTLSQNPIGFSMSGRLANDFINQSITIGYRGCGNIQGDTINNFELTSFDVIPKEYK